MRHPHPHPRPRLRQASLVTMTIVVAACAGQVADDSYVPSVAAPAYAGASAPGVCVDRAHNNAHTSDGLYAPFARLLAADGYRVRALDARLDHGVPNDCAVLVTVNPAGWRRPKLFGLNLPTQSKGRREAPAFTAREIDSVGAWVRRGGAMLLIADHYPFGSAAASLGAAFGVDMSQGFTEAANVEPGAHDRGQLLFSRDNGLLGDHPITRGRNASERVTRVVTYTGQSIAAPGATPLLVLGDSAVDYVPPAPNFTARPATGRLQGLALDVGRGRVVVLGEAAELTAQVSDRGTRFGMQVPGNDNARFALNILHWLTRLL
jgi:hypothetical protein